MEVSPNGRESRGLGVLGSVVLLIYCWEERVELTVSRRPAGQHETPAEPFPSGTVWSFCASSFRNGDKMSRAGSACSRRSICHRGCSNLN